MIRSSSMEELVDVIASINNSIGYLISICENLDSRLKELEDRKEDG